MALLGSTPDHLQPRHISNAHSARRHVHGAGAPQTQQRHRERIDGHAQLLGDKSRSDVIRDDQLSGATFTARHAQNRQEIVGKTLLWCQRLSVNGFTAQIIKVALARVGQPVA